VTEYKQTFSCQGFTWRVQSA